MEIIRRQILAQNIGEGMQHLLSVLYMSTPIEGTF